MRAITVVPGASWWQRASNSQVIVAVIAFAAGIFLLLIGFDLVSTTYRPMYVPMFLVDGCIAVLCGALVLKIIRDAQARHRALLRQLEMIATMNHHIRNALEQIQLSAHTTQNAALIQNIRTGVERIEWALREVLPSANKCD